MKLEVGVKALLQNGEGKYLFLQRANALPDGSGIRWDIPGGRIEPAEDLEAALGREVFEETGLRHTGAAKLLAAQDIFVPEKHWHVVRLTYLVRAGGDVRLGVEHQAYRWVSLAETKELNTDDYLRTFLANFAE